MNVENGLHFPIVLKYYYLEVNRMLTLRLSDGSTSQFCKYSITARHGAVCAVYASIVCCTFEDYFSAEKKNLFVPIPLC